MAERSDVIENQARDGASERSESSVGEEIGARHGAKRRGGDRGAREHLERARRSGRVGAIRTGFTIEKGFRGVHFEHISGFEGEREILGGIPGYFPDFCR